MIFSMEKRQKRHTLLVMLTEDFKNCPYDKLQKFLAALEAYSNINRKVMHDKMLNVLGKDSKFSISVIVSFN